MAGTRFRPAPPAPQVSGTSGQAALVGRGGVLVTAPGDPRSPAAGVVALDLLLAALVLLAAVLVRGSGGAAPARSS